MNQEPKALFSIGQQNKFQQLQSEVIALEEQVEQALQKQLQLSMGVHSPIPLIYVNDNIAKTGIKLAHDTIS